MSNIYEEVLGSSNIQTILEYYGLHISKNKCICPFHKDIHPSMSINNNKGIAKCFSCGVGGNSITFIEKYENEVNHNSITFKEAIQKAIDIQGLNIIIPNNNPKVQLTEEQLQKQKLNNILKDAISISKKHLASNNIECKNALSYLTNRKISKETINAFNIGYNPSFDNITNELLKKYSLQEIIDVGLIIDNNNNYVDIFNNRITIPIFDENGNAVGFGARTMQPNNKIKYLNSKETKIFNKSNLLFNFHKAKHYARNDEIIVVEGYMDVVSGKEMNMDNVVGIMGTALSKEQINMIKKLNCELTLALDNDNAGKDAMLRIIPDLLKSKIKVNILDISKLGNYKDFGDLQMANITREQIYQTKIAAFTFLMEQKYANNIQLTVENIHSIYNKMWKDGLLKDTKDYLKFKEYIVNKSNFAGDEIDKIIKPKEIKVNDRIDRYRDKYFYFYILNLIKNYANKNQDNILLKYIESGKLTQEILSKSINDEKYLKDGELTINLSSYVKDYIFNTEDYLKFKDDKVFLLDNLLNNAKTFDNKGNTVNINLSNEQKELIIKQYQESFDESIKAYIENNPDEFEEIFIANSNEQFEKLFPKTYKEIFKEQAISRFKSEGVMEAVRYGLAYTEDMKSAMSSQFVNNDKYKTLLVFNNNKNILELTVDNIKQESITKEKVVEKEKTKEENKSMSILIKLSGKEKETSKGMYLPINKEKAIYIPKQLYKKMDNQQMELMSSKSGQANMSEYSINSIEQTKQWISRISLEEFYHKYFNMYEIKIEKEVMA